MQQSAVGNSILNLVHTGFFPGLNDLLGPGANAQNIFSSAFRDYLLSNMTNWQLMPYLTVFPAIINPFILHLLNQKDLSFAMHTTDSKIPSLWDFMIGKERIEDSNTWGKISNGALALSLFTSTTFFEMTSDKGLFDKWKPDDFKKFYEKNQDVDWAKQKAGVSIYGVGGGTEKTFLGYNESGEYGIASGSVNAKLGTAEAHWSADVGMYQYDKNGNKFWSPRVAAEVGVSATVLALAADGKLQFTGKDTATTLDDFGAQAKGEINVGKVEAKVEAKSVLFDKNGNLKPELKVSGSAEAIAAEAKGSAGITVAGVEANVTGKIGFGVGAHADIGFTDGKFKVDVGAYVGLGGSIGFEVDIGGAVDAVCSGAKAVWDWITPW